MNAAREPETGGARETRAGTAGGPAGHDPGFLADRIRLLPDEQRFALAAALPVLGAPAAAPERQRNEGTHR